MCSSYLDAFAEVCHDLARLFQYKLFVASRIPLDSRTWSLYSADLTLFQSEAERCSLPSTLAIDFLQPTFSSYSAPQQFLQADQQLPNSPPPSLFFGSLQYD